MLVEGFNNKVAFIWSVADLLRGDVRPHEFGQFILPLVVLRPAGRFVRSHSLAASVLTRARSRNERTVTGLASTLSAAKASRQRRGGGGGVLGGHSDHSSRYKQDRYSLRICN